MNIYTQINQMFLLIRFTASCFLQRMIRNTRALSASARRRGFGLPVTHCKVLEDEEVGLENFSNDV